MSTRFFFRVTVDTDTYEHARQVMTERVEYDERLFEDGPEDDLDNRGTEIEYNIEFTDAEQEPEEHQS
jgi:hypothetical protein